MMQSVLHPAGPEASRILELAVVLFVGAGVIFAFVLLAAGAAWRGPERLRATLASERFVMGAGVLFPIVTLTALLAYGLWAMRSTLAVAAPADLRVEISGEQWWWRVAYVTADGARVEEANEVRLPVGRDVELVLTSPDVIHSFWVPALGGKMDMIPGRVNRLRFKVERAGVYRGQCAEYCGGPHALMAFDVVGLEPAAFDDWLARNEARAPESVAQARGRDLFFTHGCGGCHAIRGTPAAGKIGPDLTRVGARRTIGAGLLPTDAAAMARFVRDGQTIKPGNLMPPYRLFAPEDLDALSAYLASLR